MRDLGPSFVDVEAITCEYVALGTVRRREVARHVLEHRSNWTTVLFAYQDLRGDEWQPVHYMLTRWKRTAARWRLDSKINLRPELEIAAHAVFESWDPTELARAADDRDDEDDAA